MVLILMTADSPTAEQLFKLYIALNVFSSDFIL